MYLANISLRHTAADAGQSFVWAVHNPAASSKLLRLNEIVARIAFDGTAAAATIGYEFCRFTVADPTTGTTVPRVKKNRSSGGGLANSVIADGNIQQKSGILTMTSIANIEIFGALNISASVTGTTGDFCKRFDLGKGEFTLDPDEGFGIRLGVGLAAIVGQSLSGIVDWDEYPKR